MSNRAIRFGLMVVGLMMIGEARAGVLLNLQDPVGQTRTPFSLPFVAGAASTAISFAGYQVAADEAVRNIALSTGGGPNLLGSSFTLTPAPVDSLAVTFNDGTSVPGLDFLGDVVGSFDIFSQTISTVIGQSYTLSFLFTNADAPDNAPSGFVVSASDAITIAVPEPATIASLGLGVVVGAGAFIRRKWSA